VSTLKLKTVSTLFDIIMFKLKIIPVTTSLKIILGVIILLLGITTSCNVTNKIITSSRIDEPEISFGYELGKRVYFGGLSIKVWNSRGLELNFYDSNLSIINITEERWIGNNRAIYLNLDLAVAKDSYSERRTAKILFDFKRGALYVCSLEPLWRTGSRSGYNTGDSLWLSEGEFQNTLTELNK
jgi:hypothetical protein